MVIRLSVMTISYMSQLLYPVQISCSQEYSLTGEVFGSGKVKYWTREGVTSRGKKKRYTM